MNSRQATGKYSLFRKMEKITRHSIKDIDNNARAFRHILPSFDLGISVKIPRPLRWTDTEHCVDIFLLWRCYSFSDSIPDFNLSTLCFHVDFSIWFLVLRVLVVTEYTILVQHEVPFLPRILKKSTYNIEKYSDHSAQNPLTIDFS